MDEKGWRLEFVHTVDGRVVRDHRFLHDINTDGIDKNIREAKMAALRMISELKYQRPDDSFVLWELIYFEKIDI